MQPSLAETCSNHGPSPEFHRDYLITDAGLGISFEVIDKSIGNLN